MLDEVRGHVQAGAGSHDRSEHRDVQAHHLQHRRQAVHPVVGVISPEASQLTSIHAQDTANVAKLKPANPAPT
jgi:hypothetical protein